MRGVLLTIAFQILFAIGLPLLTRRIGSAVSHGYSALGAPILLLQWWGLTQWVALIPLCVWQHRKGHSLTVNAVLITGGIGFLLSAACAALFYRK
jgi:hypothetical protein